LTDAQTFFYQEFAVHVPWLLMGAMQTLTTSDSGATYVIPSSVTPLAVEIYSSATGNLLRPGPYWDANADYVWEGAKIRIPRGKTKTWSGGPVARYITPSGVIDGSTAPTLTPTHARLLLVYRACATWARRGGMRDPRPFLAAEQELWYGDPNAGRIGLLGALKMQNPFYGSAAYSAGEELTGVEHVDTGSGYSAAT